MCTNAASLPLSGASDALLRALHRATRSAAIFKLDGATLLGERAMLRNMLVPGRTSANGSCRLLDAVGDRIALNLARPSDSEMLPALLECDATELAAPGALVARIGTADAVELTARGRMLGLAIAREGEQLHADSEAPALPDRALDDDALSTELMRGSPRVAQRPVPRVLDLSALWAGPLAGHLLWLAGAEVVHVEHRGRPDAMRQGDPGFFELLNQGKASVLLDFGLAADRQVLVGLVEQSDIVIEAARPRALQQFGIDAETLTARIPGLVWITITGHGAVDEAAGWIGFGDDCGVAAGLSAALRASTGESGFLGDAVADPLTGIAAALTAWQRWQAGAGGRWSLAMRAVAGQCLRAERAADPTGWTQTLRAWTASRGQRFPSVRRRAVTAPLPPPGADTWRCAASVSRDRMRTMRSIVPN